jgi:hypothetical protein
MSYSSELVHTIIEFFYAIFKRLGARRQPKEHALLEQGRYRYPSR